jgi:hypothetical protein
LLSLKPRERCLWNTVRRLTICSTSTIYIAIRGSN